MLLYVSFLHLVIQCHRCGRQLIGFELQESGWPGHGKQFDSAPAPFTIRHTSKSNLAG